MIQQDGVWLKPRFSLLHVMGIVVAWFGISSLQHSFEVNIRTELELAAAYVPAMPAHPPTPLAQQQQSNKPKGRVFVCGYMSNGQRYFPDYQYMGEWDTKKYAVTTTGNDLLLIGAFGPCDVTEVKYILRDFFAGKVLYINGEPYGNVFWRDWTPAFKAQHLVIPKEWWEELHEQQRAGDDVFHPHISRVFQIGPYPLIQERDVTNSSEMTLDDVKHKVYNKQSLAVFYGTVSIAYKVDEIWQFLADHSKKPQNNGRYRAIAWISKNCVQHRIDAAQQLSQDVPIPVHNGGKCAVSSDYNPDNQPMPAEFHVDRVKRENNHLIFRNFKYCLVMENNNVTGYLSEKIIFAYLGGCMPIYWGTHHESTTGKDFDVFDVFHPDSFIYYDPDHPEVATNLIKQLEANETEYKRRLRDVPILRNGMETADKYFSLLPNMGRGTINKRLREMMGLLPL